MFKIALHYFKSVGAAIGFQCLSPLPTDAIVKNIDAQKIVFIENADNQPAFFGFGQQAMLHCVFGKGLYAHFWDDGLQLHIVPNFNNKVEAVVKPELLYLEVIGNKSKLTLNGGDELVVGLQNGAHQLRKLHKVAVRNIFFLFQHSSGNGVNGIVCKVGFYLILNAQQSQFR